MKILVINCGSSSLKFQLIDMSNENPIAKGNVERIGVGSSFMKYEADGKDKITIEREMDNHKSAMQFVIDTLKDPNIGVIQSVDEISAVGHRVVHGGEHFSSSVIITESVIKAIVECVELAPLHNPPNLMGIDACKELMPKTKMVAVFDTAFHQTMPKESFIYALPYEMYEKHRIRRYGFHGTSHKYVSSRGASFLGKDIKDLKIVSCHLGNGSSICAIKNGESYVTSMGFTPLEGLPMGTRSGNIDPAIIKYIMDKENIDTKKMDEYLNKKSGMLGITGLSSDFRDIENQAINGNERAELALNIFANSVKRYIGAYAALMNGLDVLIFTAGVGEKSDIVRTKITENMDFLGIIVDAEKNKIRGKEVDISTPEAKVRTLIIPTNEELMIARETASLIK